MLETSHDPLKECPPSPRSTPQWDSLQNRRTALAILLLIIAAGLVLRSYGLYGRSIWFDESISWRSIQFPFAEMIERTARDIHPPLFYVLLRLWTAAFGEGIVALRSFSLAMSALAMLGVYLFTVEAMGMGRSLIASPHPLRGAKEGNAQVGPHPLPLSPRERGEMGRARWIGLAATALFAVSLYQVRMAWEIRMYSLGTALAMFSAWLLLRALAARPQRGRLWLLYMLAGLLLAYTHYCALFSLLAQSSFALSLIVSDARCNLKAALKDVRLRWLAFSCGGMAAGWSAWLPVFLEQRRRVAEGWHHNVPFSLHDIPAMCYEMFFHPEVHGSAFSYAVVVTAVCGFAVLAILWRGGAGQWCAACLALVPLGMMSLASSTGSNLMIVRYMAFLQPFLLIAIAAAIWRIPIDWLRDLIASALVAAGLLLHVDFVDSLDIPNRPGASAAAAYIDAHRAPGEPVIACSPLLLFPALYHARQREGWHVYSNRPELPHYAAGPVIVAGDIFSDHDMDAVRAKRAWVVTSSGDWAGWGLYIPPAWLQTSEQRFPEVYGFQNDVKVLCYEIPE